MICSVCSSFCLNSLYKSYRAENFPIARCLTHGCPCAFLTSFDCHVIITQVFDGPFHYDVIIEKFAKRCHVGHLAIGQLYNILSSRCPHSILSDVTNTSDVIAKFQMNEVCVRSSSVCHTLTNQITARLYYTCYNIYLCNLLWSWIKGISYDKKRNWNSD